MYGRDGTLKIGKTNARAVIPEVLELMSAGTLHPELVTTTVAEFGDAPEALIEHVHHGYAKTVIARGHA